MAHTAQVLTSERQLRLVRDGDVPVSAPRLVVVGGHPTDRGVVATASAPRVAAARAAGSQGSLRDLRLTRRGWWVLSVVAVVVVALGMALGDRAFASAPAEPVAVSDYYVSAGETLWQIAGSIAAPGEDVRDVVEMLVDLNGRSSASLQVGERLLVPIQ